MFWWWNAPTREFGEISICHNGEKTFSISGDAADAKTRQELITALRETLLRLPPEEGEKVVADGIAIDFSAPELEELIRNETAMKTRRF